MATWDVSQNVDRFNIDVDNVDKVITNFGILPCITPEGCEFASNRHQAHNGSQLLVLQGMPLDKLHFGKETQKDRQDLAGNAMSTTVIGASIISALICACKSFATESPPGTIAADSAPLPKSNSFVQCLPTKDTTIERNVAKHLNIAQLLHDTKVTARLCNCEAGMTLSSAPIQVCSSCLHTACSHCAGNPKHAYESEVTPAQRGLSPEQFVRKWRRQLPTRLSFSNLPAIRQLVSADHRGGDLLQMYVDHATDTHIEAQYFHIGTMLRKESGWVVNYTSSQASLELRIGPVLQWLLFLNCPQHMAGNHPLRQLLERPIARTCSIDTSDLLKASEWQIYIPHDEPIKLRLSSSSPRTISWKNRLGLTDYKTETVPT
jgi:hypothetical protein